jgi:hypothetical protein
MKKVMIGALAVAMTAVSGSALADSKSFAIGGAVDLSVPAGAAVGVQGRLPYLPWFKVGLSGTFLLSPGVRGNLLIDPIKFPVAPVADLAVGYQSDFTVPGVKKSPTLSYTYENLDAGLAFGSRDHFRFLLLAGMTHLDGSATGVNGLFTLPGHITLGNPNFNAWVPNAKLGVEFLF